MRAASGHEGDGLTPAMRGRQGRCMQIDASHGVSGRILKGPTTTGRLAGSRLAVILSSPPVRAGRRTRDRVNSLAKLLEVDSYEMANIFAFATTDVNQITTLGASMAPWLQARRPILDALRVSNAVLLAYGVSEPCGVARANCRQQISWLWEAIDSAGISKVFTVGGRPYHPSRWHRLCAKEDPPRRGTVAEQARDLIVRINTDVVDL